MSAERCANLTFRFDRGDWRGYRWEHPHFLQSDNSTRQLWASSLSPTLRSLTVNVKTGTANTFRLYSLLRLDLITKKLIICTRCSVQLARLLIPFGKGLDENDLGFLIVLTHEARAGLAENRFPRLLRLPMTRRWWNFDWDVGVKSPIVLDGDAKVTSCYSLVEVVVGVLVAAVITFATVNKYRRPAESL